MSCEYNSGVLEEHIVQNRFTAYLKISVKHHRARYIQRLYLQQQIEKPLDDPDDCPAVDTDYALSETQLYTSLSQLRGEARIILLDHILQGKPLIQLARELSMPYPTIKANYRRALEKLRKELLRDEFY